jgi:hypothetical protein
VAQQQLQLQLQNAVNNSKGMLHSQNSHVRLFIDMDPGRCEPSPVHASVQLILLRHAVTAVRRIDPRHDRTHQEHRAHQLDQLVQSLACDYGFQFHIYTHTIQEHLWRRHRDWLADISESVEPESGC